MSSHEETLKIFKKNIHKRSFHEWQELLEGLEKQANAEATKNKKGILHELEELYDAFLSYFPFAHKELLNYVQILTKNNKKDKAGKCFEKAFQATKKSPKLWVQYIDWVSKNLSPSPKETRESFTNAKEEIAEHFQAGIFWEKYIDFETKNGNLSNANSLYFEVMKVPNDKLEILHDKYINFLETNIEEISKSVNSNHSHQKLSEFDISFAMLLSETQGDINALKQKIKEVFENTMHEYKTLNAFEQKVSFNSNSLNIFFFSKKIKSHDFQGETISEEEYSHWFEYIDFQKSRYSVPDRVIFLFERALIPLSKSKEFWTTYIRYAEKELKDNEKARSLFERCTQYALKHDPDIFIENALFEEEQGNLQKARKIYEKIENDIAPGLLKSINSFINFEKRCQNFDKAQELFEKAINDCYERKDNASLCFLVTQYSRFLEQKRGNLDKAIEVYERAVEFASTYMDLYLSYINFLKYCGSKNVENFDRIIKTFERAINSEMKKEEKKVMQDAYIAHVNEYCTQVSFLRTTKNKIRGVPDVKKQNLGKRVYPVGADADGENDIHFQAKRAKLE